MKEDDKLPWYGWLISLLFAIVSFGLLVWIAAMNNTGNIDRKIATV